jgi:hypothetical protein
MDTMALFYSTDDKPKFGYVLCNESTLTETITKTLYHEPSDEHLQEAAILGATLLEDQGMDFEDGWIALRVGLKDVAEFLMEKVSQAKDDEAWSEKERFEEHVRRREAEKRYAELRDALAGALGDKGPEIAAKAAA